MLRPVDLLWKWIMQTSYTNRKAVPMELFIKKQKNKHVQLQGHGHVEETVVITRQEGDGTSETPRPKQISETPRSHPRDAPGSTPPSRDLFPRRKLTWEIDSPSRDLFPQ